MVIRESLEERLGYLAEQFESNEYDVVALGRALIADPMWVEKIRTGDPAQVLPFERKNHSLSGS